MLGAQQKKLNKQFLMKSILIFTYSDRENSPFLPLWISYYSKIKNSKLVILCRNSKPNIPNEYLNLIELIDVNHFFGEKDVSYVPPNKLFMDYQTIFLESYDVVVYSDMDEFIVHDNLNEVLQSDFNQCLVTTGIEIVDYIPNDEPFVFTKNITEQRNFMVYSVWYNKPLIVNSLTSWSGGKHNNHIYNNYVNDLYLIHLGKVCMTLTKNLFDESKILYPKHNFVDNLESYYKKNFNNPKHGDQPMIEIPEKIKLLLNNII